MAWFLIILALIWLIIASIQDIKKREVDNWVSFSLIVFALAYRAFYSTLNNDLWFFLYGLIGLAVFIVLGYLFYYARIFAGGDAKLLMGLGAVLPLSSGIFYNLILLGCFVLVFLFIGGIYGLIFSSVLTLKNKERFVKEFRKQFKLRKNLLYVFLPLFFISLISPFYFNDNLLFVLPFLFLLSPMLLIYAKAVEESCMIVSVSSKKLTAGDWLYEEVKIGKKIIKPYWEGLSEEEVKILKAYNKKIKIKQGIPFIPVFLFSFVLFLIFKNI